MKKQKPSLATARDLNKPPPPCNSLGFVLPALLAWCLVFLLVFVFLEFALFGYPKEIGKNESD